MPNKFNPMLKGSRKEKRCAHPGCDVTKMVPSSHIGPYMCIEHYRESKKRHQDWARLGYGPN